jgi:hypothetical protein
MVTIPEKSFISNIPQAVDNIWRNTDIMNRPL